MNQNFRKTALMVGAFSLLGLCYSPKAYAAEAPQDVQQATKKITGTVVDAQGPVIGASVIEKGTSNGVVTDFDGNFTLNVKPGATIVISYIGYTTQEIAVGNRSTISVTLKEDNALLDEVVVVGYGVQKKKLVTGATVEVKGEDIANRNTISPLTALQNQSPGVNIVASSGKPGDGFKVNIRGAGTNGNTAPLYVIDGVPGDINSINPADIERIDVLKDAASSAIYGARAANGVILVTTKQGKAGSVQVNYDGNIGWQNIVKLPQMLNAKQYMDVQDMTNFNAGQPIFNWSNYVDEDLLEAYRNGTNPGTDWLDLIRNKNAITTSHSINITGGSEMSKFSTGAGYQYQDGIIGGSLAPSDYRRFTLRLNSDHVLLKTGDHEIITFGENVYYQHVQSKGIQIGNQYSNAIYNMLSANPLVPLYNAAGEYFDRDDLESSGKSGFLSLNQYVGNPINSLVHNQSALNKSRSHNLSATAYITISPIKGLTYKALGYYKNYSSLWKGLSTVYSNNNNDQNTEASLSQSMGTGWNWGMTHTLQYLFDIKDNHFDVLVGTEYSREGNNMGDNLTGSAVNKYDNIFDISHAYFDNFTGRTSGVLIGNPSDDHSILSYFGRINYDYAEKYMLSLILRADGSSNFASGKRWGWFPSFSAGWVVSNEKFMKSTSDWLSFLKIRGSWGQNGNEGIGAFKYLAAYSFGWQGLYSFDNAKVASSGVQGGYLSRLPNPDLTWETSEQLDLGFDARFLNGKLGLNFDYYVKKTKDLLIDVPVSAINGFATKVMNAGTIKNSGFEVALNWRDNIGKDFNYNIGFNVATNKNEVTEVNNGSGYINGGNNLLSEGTTYMARMEEGHPIGYFWGYKTAGVIQNEAERDAYAATLKNGAASSLQGSSLAPGDLRYVDINGDGVIDESDKTELGDPHPDVTMGINLGFDYKGFDFAVSGYAALGQQIAHTYRKFGNGQFDNWTTDVYNYWHGEGTGNGRYPILLPGNTTNHKQISDIYIDDAGYFRLQSLTVGYDFAKLWKNNLFSQLRVYFQAQNLFTITKYDGMDPECGTSIGSESWVTGVDVGNYPQPRIYMVGVNIKFNDKREVKKPVAAAPIVDNSEINRLNSEIDRLRAENEQLRNQKPEKEVVVKKDIVTFPYLVNFTVNTTDVVNREKVNLETIANMIKSTPDKKYSVVGYADMQTGTAEGNAQLAQGRAQNVYDILINQYGVSPSQLVKDSKGGVDYMYFNDEQLSRSVIISEAK